MRTRLFRRSWIDDESSCSYSVDEFPEARFHLVADSLPLRLGKRRRCRFAYAHIVFHPRSVQPLIAPGAGAFHFVITAPGDRALGQEQLFERGKINVKLQSAAFGHVIDACASR